MATPAQGLKIRHVPRVAARAERCHVIAFEHPGPTAQHATPAVPIEDLPPHGRPPATIEAHVCVAHTIPM